MNVVEEPSSSPWRARLGIAVAVGALAALLLIAGRWVWLEWSKVRWNAHLQEAAAWYEENVGSLDLQSYRLPPVDDEHNAGVQLLLLLGDFPLADAERVELSRWTDRAFGLYRTEEEAQSDAVWTEEDEEALRTLIAQSDVYLRRLDEWSQLTDSSLGLVSGDEFPEELMKALQVSRLRLAETAVRLEDGDCHGVTDLLRTHSRLAAVLGPEPHLIASMLSWVPERTFYEGTQRVLEASLRGDCESLPSLAELRRLFDSLDGRTALLSRAFAAEGAFIYSATSEEANEHDGGANPCFMTSSPLVALGGLSARLRGDEVSSPPDQGWMSSTCSGVAEILMPNLMDAATKSRRSHYARSLTGRLLTVAECVAQEDCSLAELSPFLGPGDTRAAISGEGASRRVRLSPAVEDSPAPYRQRTLETIELPAMYASAF